jgi:hypothetical protein
MLANVGAAPSLTSLGSADPVSSVDKSILKKIEEYLLDHSDRFGHGAIDLVCMDQRQ